MEYELIGGVHADTSQQYRITDVREYATYYDIGLYEEGSGWDTRSFAEVAEGNMRCTLDKQYGYVPQRGDLIKQYPGGLGALIRGMAVYEAGGWRTLYYRTVAEDRLHYNQQSFARLDEQVTRYFAVREDLHQRRAQLPEVFQRRLLYFASSNPAFLYGAYEYELVICELAVFYATLFPDVEAFLAFTRLSWEEQAERLGGNECTLDPRFAGLSGNQVGLAKRLAWMYYTDPALVVAAHAGLAPLTGCAGQGCEHPRPDWVWVGIGKPLTPMHEEA